MITKEIEPTNMRIELDKDCLLARFCDALLRERIITGLPQKQIANRCGIKQAHYSRLERGEVSMNIGVMERLARGFNKKIVINFVDI